MKEQHNFKKGKTTKTIKYFKKTKQLNNEKINTTNNWCPNDTTL